MLGIASVRRSRTLSHEVGRVARLGADGGIAQLVEHYAGSVRVRSSSLLASTKERPFSRAFFSFKEATDDRGSPPTLAEKGEREDRSITRR